MLTYLKTHNLNRDYRAAIQRLHDLGVMINGSFVFGLDGDTSDVFKRTVDWSVEMGITTATFHIATPYPGTRFHQNMRDAGRMLSLADAVHTPRPGDEMDAAGRHVRSGENEVGRSLPPDDEADATRETPSGTAEYVVAARLTADGTFFDTELWGVPIEVTGGAVFDVVRIVNNDHVSGALLWDMQFSPYISVSTIFGE